jgi:hypothetical protein
VRDVSFQQNSICFHCSHGTCWWKCNDARGRRGCQPIQGRQACPEASNRSCKAEAKGKKIKWLARRKYVNNCVTEALKDHPNMDITQMLKKRPDITNLPEEKWDEF